MLLNELRIKFEELEKETIGASFGGPALPGKAPSFDFSKITEWFIDNIDNIPNEISERLLFIKMFLNESSFKYLINVLFRFSFCIELTNLKISSTKMKTRWMRVKILKTKLGTYENYLGDFSPGLDQRSSTYEECLEVFYRCIELLANSSPHIDIFNYLSKKRGFPYEGVFTYINPSEESTHLMFNIRLVALEDIKWLIDARPLITPIIDKRDNGAKSKLIQKILTKCYKTDRSQTGEVQTNRAKRWECLSQDFQYASIEECWSVERKLLSDLAHFVGFPEESKQVLIEKGLFGPQTHTICPITFRPMILQEILNGGAHGESSFQVGHMKPLKRGGKHTSGNIEWISGDGNRIQGSLNIEDTRRMLIEIFEGMKQNGLIK